MIGFPFRSRPRLPGVYALAFLFCVGVSLSFVLSARADWPHVRGPNYDGISAERNLADVWPADGPRRLWSRDLGQGYSGFVVAEGRLFTQRQAIGGQYLLCLDPETGEAIWEYRYDWAWQPKGSYPGPYATPTCHKGKVFFTSTTGLVGCVDAKTGTQAWSINLKEKFKGKGFEFGYAASPLVEDDKVIVPAGGRAAGLVALHESDGSVAWTAGADPASYCGAMPITLAGRRFVVGYMQNALILVDPASGKVLYRQALSAGYDEHSAWPIYREPHLLLTAPFRAPATRHELSMGPDGALSCKLNWLSKELSNDVVSSVLHGQHVYGFDLRDLQSRTHRASRGAFKCIDWDTGKLCWSTEEVGHASVLIADGKLFMLSDTGALILARADSASYQELARTQLFDDEICWTPPTLWQGRLFVRSPSRALCLHVGTSDRMPADVGTQPSAPRSWRFETAWLMSREREYPPNDAPTWEEMTLWFAAGVIVLVVSALATGLIRFAAKRMCRWEVAGAAVFYPLALALGFLGPNTFSSLADRVLFTWPACLYVAFHAAVLACGWAEERPKEERGPRWRARLVVLAFLLIGYAYYEMCSAVGMFIGWSFLVGFPMAFPFTVLAVRASLKEQRIWVVGVWTLLAYSAFFWSAQGLFIWQGM